MGETSPLTKADILRIFPDNDEADAPQEKGEPPIISTRDQSALISRDSTVVPVLAGAASGSIAAPASASWAGAPAPWVAKLSGFRLPKRRDYAVVDQ